MLNTKKLFIGSLLLATSLIASQDLSKKELSQLEELNIFKKSKITLTKGIDADSLYILNVKVKDAVDTIFLTKDKKYIISGNVINANDGKQLTMPVDISILKDKEAFTYGTGSDEYFLFTDPQCPYCKKFESYLPQLKDKVKIKLFYFPLAFHKDARDLAIYITSKKTTEEKIKTMFETNEKSEAFKNRKIDEKTKEKLGKKIDEQMQLGIQIGVQGTPALIDKKGNKMSWVDLLEKYDIKLK